MFEQSLVESGGLIKTKSKYWTILTFFLVSSVFAIMILIPLIYPEALPRTAMTAMLTAPAAPPAAGCRPRRGCQDRLHGQQLPCAYQDSA